MSKTGAAKVQSAAMGHNSANLKSIIERLGKLKAESDDVRMKILNVYNQAEDQGFDRKALKIVFKEWLKPVPAQMKAEINRMREQLGDLPLFNAAIAKFDEETKANDNAEIEAA